MKLRNLAAVLAIGFMGTPALAADLSMLTGLYKTESNKTGGDESGSKDTIEFGSRYGDKFDGEMVEWFGQGSMILRSYDAGENDLSPSNSTSLRLGGGIRSYFDPLTENVAPFAYILGEYRADKDGTFQSNGYTETEASGLYYSAAIGMRMGLDGTFFVDFETNLFESALRATEESTTVTEVGGVETTTESETTKTELYGDSSASLATMGISLGMRF
jgi:hypothetical protein